MDITWFLPSEHGYDGVYVLTSGRNPKGYTFKPAKTITVRSLLRPFHNNHGKHWTAIYRASADGHPYELLRYAYYPEGLGRSSDNPDWYFEVKVNPLTLSPDEWYLIARCEEYVDTGANCWDFRLDFDSGDTFNINNLIANEDIIADWKPRPADPANRRHYFHAWGIALQGHPSAIVGHDPLDLSVSIVDYPPALGLGYGGFNIWVKKSGEWLLVPEIWVKKGGVWNPVTEVWTKKGGVWNPV